MTNPATNSVDIFDNIKIYYNFSRRNRIDSMQLSFGGVVEGEDSIQRDIKLLNYNLRQFFYRKSKDGYFKDKFIFIEKPNDSLLLKKKGILFFEVFLFMEETYERKFLMDYLETLFPELSQIYTNHKSLKSTKYNDGKVTKQKKSQKESY